MSAEIREPAGRLLQTVQLLLSDVDGVLTDGGLYYGEAGETDRELKKFNVKDGLGVRLLMESGLEFGVITGRFSPAVARRCGELRVRLCYEGVDDKRALLDQVVKASGVRPAQMAFIGDDLPDIPLMKRVGLAIAVADAHPRVQAAAGYVTRANGGAGAVREVCEAILKARGLWEQCVERFLE